MKKYWIIAFVLIIFISNFSPVNYFLIDDYTYSNIDGSFKFSEEGGKGLNYTNVVRNYAIFLCQHPEKDQGDNRLFRTFTLKPWRFWEWSQWIFRNERFLLPYLEPGKL
jgi:hypothetical protein